VQNKMKKWTKKDLNILFHVPIRKPWKFTYSWCHASEIFNETEWKVTGGLYSWWYLSEIDLYVMLLLRFLALICDMRFQHNLGKPNEQIDLHLQILTPEPARNINLKKKKKNTFVKYMYCIGSRRLRGIGPPELWDPGFDSLYGLVCVVLRSMRHCEATVRHPRSSTGCIIV